jgi:hypothetical protein
VIWQTPDVGLVALVLCKPLEMTLLREITAPVERNCLADFNKMPEIQDDAYGEGYQDGLDAAPCALEAEETSTEESPEE